ncbi:MAG: hypothetical protein E6R13_03835 [Spirochaetes bacterium]|nr:MAG: hypothetical protein E6R13_03835 [Spirochaetota bacterium]
MGFKKNDIIVPKRSAMNLRLGRKYKVLEINLKGSNDLEVVCLTDPQRINFRTSSNLYSLLIENGSELSSDEVVSLTKRMGNNFKNKIGLSLLYVVEEE